MSDKQKDIPSTVKLREELQRKNDQFKMQDDIFGMTLLTNPGYISSSRNIMFTKHLVQFVNLNKPDFPKVSTNYENVVGRHSTGYYKAKSDLQIIDKIPKFNNGVNEDHSYFLFTYDEKKDKYDLIIKKNVEDLTEKFGFVYNNEVMDNKQVGDTVKKDEVLYKSTSYDDDLNYCYGRNATFMYMLENDTIEDAVIVSKSFSESTLSKEIETVKVSLNDNDILCNIYGDKDVYKTFPDIGEYVKDTIVCSKRRIHNNQLLYDLKKSNLRKINYASDINYFCPGRVADIIIYSNKELDEIEDNSFNSQIRYYLKLQQEFYTKVYRRCKEIINSGSKYSKDIGYYYTRAKNIIDPEYKWIEDNNSVFSNVVIEFVIERDVPLDVGHKITGRFGNKGVISKVKRDEEMPVLENGKRVDIIFNVLGVINRWTSNESLGDSKPL